MIVIIDNYDSFTYNLVQYFGEILFDSQADHEIKVFRNDQATAAEVIALRPNYLVISPGPGNPRDSGVSMELISKLSGKLPILGICLGHQCIGAVFGGKVVKAPVPAHGKIGRISHNGRDLFLGIDQPFSAMRYHSLVVERKSIPDVLEVTAVCDETEEKLVMGLRHRKHPTFGVQFHPESFFTAVGQKLLKNFLNEKYM